MYKMWYRDEILGRDNGVFFFVMEFIVGKEYNMFLLFRCKVV